MKTAPVGARRGSRRRSASCRSPRRRELRLAPRTRTLCAHTGGRSACAASGGTRSNSDISFILMSRIARPGPARYRTIRRLANDDERRARRAGKARSAASARPLADRKDAFDTSSAVAIGFETATRNPTQIRRCTPRLASTELGRRQVDVAAAQLRRLARRWTTRHAGVEAATYARIAVDERAIAGGCAPSRRRRRGHRRITPIRATGTSDISPHLDADGRVRSDARGVVVDAGSAKTGPRTRARVRATVAGRLVHLAAQRARVDSATCDALVREVIRRGHAHPRSLASRAAPPPPPRRLLAKRCSPSITVTTPMLAVDDTAAAFSATAATGRLFAGAARGRRLLRNDGNAPNVALGAPELPRNAAPPSVKKNGRPAAPPPSRRISSGGPLRRRASGRERLLAPPRWRPSAPPPSAAAGSAANDKLPPPSKRRPRMLDRRRLGRAVRAPRNSSSSSGEARVNEPVSAGVLGDARLERRDVCRVRRRLLGRDV